MKIIEKEFGTIYQFEDKEVNKILKIIKKYRIKQIDNDYYPQYKLFGFWINAKDTFSRNMNSFNSFIKAKTYLLDMIIKDNYKKEKIISNINITFNDVAHYLIKNEKD